MAHPYFSQSVSPVAHSNFNTIDPEVFAKRMELPPEIRYKYTKRE